MRGRYIKQFLILAVALFGLSATYQSKAALSVTGSGLAVQTFNALPAAADWATGLMTGDGNRFNMESQLDADIQTNTAAGISLALPTSATDPPSTFATSFRYNTTR